MSLAMTGVSQGVGMAQLSPTGSPGRPLRLSYYVKLLPLSTYVYFRNKLIYNNLT
jgi:hypothetical protein